MYPTDCARRLFYNNIMNYDVTGSDLIFLGTRPPDDFMRINI